MFRVGLNMASAASVRDTLSKYIYSSLREHIMTTINNQIKPLRSTNCIGLLDMPGFGNLYIVVYSPYNWNNTFSFHFILVECFQNNSLDQLFINFANEKIQQYSTENLITKMNKTDSSEYKTLHGGLSECAISM